MNPLSFLTGKVSAAIIGALAAAIIGLSVTIWGLPLIGGGLLAKIEKRTAERDTARAEVAALVADSKRRVNVGKEALREAEKRTAPIREQRIKLIPAPNDGRCATNPVIAESDV